MGASLKGTARADPVQQIAAGWGHTCALVTSGKVYCWGARELNGSDHDAASPLLVSGLPKTKAISAGLTNTCAIDLTDRAWCWGANWKETFEQKSLVHSHIPNPVEGIAAATQIAIGYSHVCAIVKTDGSVWCWGSNGVGELGEGSTVDHGQPVRAGSIMAATSIAAGVANTCAALADGDLYCWGRDTQRGKGIIVKSLTPVKVDRLNNVTKVVNGRNFFCALAATGEIFCFGSNIFLQLGNKDVGRQYAPPIRSRVPAATDIAANIFSACAVLKTKRVSCWGIPIAGTDGTRAIEPTEIAALNDVKNITLGLSSACALLYSGKIHCWGSGYLGDGQNYTTPTNIPTEVKGLP